MNLNTITLGGFPVYEADDVVGLNRFVMRTGASRYGRGWFLMRRPDYDSLSGQSTAQLVMNGDPGPGLTMTVVVAGAEPISTAVGSDRTQDLVKVTVYDQRCQNFGYIKKAYNCMQSGFPVSGGNPTCYSSTLNSSSPWTWQQLIQDTTTLSTAKNAAQDQPGLPSDLSTWTPYNLIWDNVPAARVIDDIAAQLFYVVGFDHQAPASTASWLFDPGTGTFQSNKTLYERVTNAGALIGGGDGFRNETRLPTQIVVTFPGTGGSDPFTNRFYTKTISSGFEDAQGEYQLPLHVGNQIAIYSSGSWANQSNLDAVAQDLATAFCTFAAQPILQYEIAGIWPFKPDGVYRQVEWISDKNGARTILKSDNARDWLPTDQLNDPINGVCPQEVVVLGGGLASVGSGGVKYVSTAVPPGVVMYVQLTQTGGSIGTQTTTSSWTYTAKDINNNQLGTSLSPAFGRRNGALAAATAGQGHFNTSGTFVLDLAFEGTGTGHC